ncbi:MAG: pyridoxal phosphate-dependent aminotransferase [Acidobacteria bacterium]|nr:MAG: pyridoxal phosphate-dependent aminotransferase [Acidobacteriota bacterium]
MRLSSRLARVTPSQTMAMKQAADEQIARGHSVIDFGPGEPDQDTPAHVVAAAKAALDAGQTHYTASAGLPVLRAALAVKLGRRAGVTLDPSSILVTCGGKSGIFYVMLALLEDGDEAVIPSPCWVSFPEQVKLAGGKPVLVPFPARQGFEPRLDDLAAAITARTRLIVINSPANPTGAVVDPAFWGELATLAREHDLVVLSDETYLDFVYDGAVATSALTARSLFGENLVVVGSFSKAYAMTGWRVGYTWSESALTQGLRTLQSQDTTHPATFAQLGALAALEGPQEPLQAMVAAYARRRRLILSELEKVPGFVCVPPRGAFYVFPDVRGAMERVGCKDDMEFAVRALQEAGVAMVAGGAFACPGHVRLTYAVSEEDIREGVARLARWVGGSGM